MIIAISYADDKYKDSENYNLKSALKFGADRVIAYGPEDIDEEVKKKASDVFSRPRGGGYWAWKPYVILKTLNSVEENDIVIYTDAGACFVDKISYFLDVMDRDNVDLMVFAINRLQKKYVKRDCAVILGMDSDEYLNVNQVAGGYSVIRNNEKNRKLFEEWFSYCCDPRAITDDENVLGLPNYDCFVEHRHDQSIWTFLCEKHGIKPYRDPSQFGFDTTGDPIPEEILKRSTYPQIINSHRMGNLKYSFQLNPGKNILTRCLNKAYNIKNKFARK